MAGGREEIDFDFVFYFDFDFDFKTSPPNSVASGREEIEQGMNSWVSHAFSNNSEIIFGHVIRGTI